MPAVHGGAKTNPKSLRVVRVRYRQSARRINGAFGNVFTNRFRQKNSRNVGKFVVVDEHASGFSFCVLLFNEFALAATTDDLNDTVDDGGVGMPGIRFQEVGK